MVGYYRPFIKNFAFIAKSLTELTRKDKPSEWLDSEQLAFETLKNKITENPILVYPDFSKNFYIACDASTFTFTFTFTMSS